MSGGSMSHLSFVVTSAIHQRYFEPCVEKAWGPYDKKFINQGKYTLPEANVLLPLGGSHPVIAGKTLRLYLQNLRRAMRIQTIIALIRETRPLVLYSGLELNDHLVFTAMEHAGLPWNFICTQPWYINAYFMKQVTSDIRLWCNPYITCSLARKYTGCCDTLWSLASSAIQRGFIESFGGDCAPLDLFVPEMRRLPLPKCVVEDLLLELHPPIVRFWIFSLLTRLKHINVIEPGRPLISICLVIQKYLKPRLVDLNFIIPVVSAFWRLTGQVVTQDGIHRWRKFVSGQELII